MTEADVANVHAYEMRFAAAQRVEGVGWLARRVVPCPFCAMPGWATWRIAPEHLEEDMAREWTCRYCRRSARVLKIQLPGEPTVHETVQTGGPDPAEWMREPGGPGWPRRIVR